MIALQKYDGPFGIPIYHQSMPDIVKSVSMAWVVFTGSADDESVGTKGLYHWLEHVPFRGTKKYPGGYRDTCGRFNKWGGQINAWTNPHMTVYWAHVPFQQWREALSVITDLLSNPLLTNEGINAERQIIKQEIQMSLASSRRYARLRLDEILWSNHPFGHHALGSSSSLSEVDASRLRHAHKTGYDRSRLMFVSVGNILERELRTEIDTLSIELPDNGLPTRRCSSFHCPLPLWQNSRVTEIETGFASSIVMMLFPVPNNSDHNTRYLYRRAHAELLEFGGMSSPIYKVIREERRLAYHAEFTERYCPGGGYVGFLTEAKKDNVEPLLEAYGDLLKDSSVCSKERIQEVREGLPHLYAMRSIDPGEYVSDFITRFLGSDTAISDKECCEAVCRLTPNKACQWISDLSPEKSHVVIFKGMGG